MKKITLTLVTLAIAIGGLAIPSPAQASNQTVSVTCVVGQGVKFMYGVKADRGDTVTFNYSGCTWVSFGGSSVIPTDPSQNSTSTGNAIPRSGTVSASIVADEVAVIATFAPTPPTNETTDRTFVVTSEAPVADTTSTPPQEPALAEPPPSPYTFLFVRSQKDCSIGTLTALGVDPSSKLYLTWAYMNEGVSYGGQVNKVASRSTVVWRFRLDSRADGDRGFPRRAFQLNISVWKNPTVGGIGAFEGLVPACKK